MFISPLSPGGSVKRYPPSGSIGLDSGMSKGELEQVIPEEVAKAGQELYESKLKQLLEPESNGGFVAIEPASSSYFIGNTIVEALHKAELNSPNGEFHVVRIGFPAAVSFNHKVIV